MLFYHKLRANSSISSYVFSERASVRLLVNDEVVPVRVSELSEPDKKVSHSTEQSLNGKEKPASDLGSGFKGMESKKLKDDSKIKVREGLELTRNSI